MSNSYTRKTVFMNGYHSNLFYLNLFILPFLFLQCGQLYSQNLSAEKIYKKVSDAVVVIYAYDSNNKLSKQGSGVVINDKGYVVTNYHVLGGNDRLELFHNKEIVPYVDIIGIDVEKDILILKINEKKFPAIKIGDSKSLNIGQRIYAIGSPLGFENTISEGIISGLRSYDESGKNFIQITASISPGSSGGAVVNDKGELIGISTLTVKEGQNLNFAIPIDDVLSVEINSYSKNDAYKDFYLFAMGIDEYNKRNFKESINHFTNYIKEYPNDEGSYNNRGLSKNGLEDYEGAIKDFDKAIEINPNLKEAYTNRGLAKLNLGNYIEAIEDYDSGLKINPNDADSYHNRGFAKGKLEDHRGAIQDFNKAIEIDPFYASAYYNLGNQKSKLYAHREAIQVLNKAIEIDPIFADAYSLRGFEKGELDDYRGAIQDYNKAIELNPNDKVAYYNRGVTKYKLGDKSGACWDLSKAGELGFYDAYDIIRENCN